MNTERYEEETEIKEKKAFFLVRPCIAVSSS